jgi:hypothetical protein
MLVAGQPPKSGGGAAAAERLHRVLFTCTFGRLLSQPRACGRCHLRMWLQNERQGVEKLTSCRAVSTRFKRVRVSRHYDVVCQRCIWVANGGLYIRRSVGTNAIHNRYTARQGTLPRN